MAPPTFDEMSPVAPPTLAQPDTFAYEDMSAPGVGLDDVPPPPCSTPSNLLDLWQFVPQGDSQYIPDLDLATCLHAASSMHAVADVVDLCDSDDGALPMPSCCPTVWQALM